jgi:hypothetical protein
MRVAPIRIKSRSFGMFRRKYPDAVIPGLDLSMYHRTVETGMKSLVWHGNDEVRC